MSHNRLTATDYCLSDGNSQAASASRHWRRSSWFVGRSPESSTPCNPESCTKSPDVRIVPHLSSPSSLFNVCPSGSRKNPTASISPQLLLVRPRAQHRRIAFRIQAHSSAYKKSDQQAIFPLSSVQISTRPAPCRPEPHAVTSTYIRIYISAPPSPPPPFSLPLSLSQMSSATVDYGLRLAFNRIRIASLQSQIFSSFPSRGAHVCHRIKVSRFPSPANGRLQFVRHRVVKVVF
jgi:hypothetical protein